MIITSSTLTDEMIRRERDLAMNRVGAGGFSLMCTCARALNEYGLASEEQVMAARSAICDAINARTGVEP